MPRRSRNGKPGLLYHIIARGNEERKIFQDDFDRNNFPERLGQILTETKTLLQAQGIDVAKIAARISQLMGVQPLGFGRPAKNGTE